MSEQALMSTSSPDSPRSVSDGKHTPSLYWLATWIAILSLSAFIASLLVIFTHAKQGFFVPILTAVVCTVAALFDARFHRIPNQLTYTAALLGFAFSLLGWGFDHYHFPAAVKWLAAPEPLYGLVGFAVCIVLVIIGSLFGPIGGGDLKLFAALGALLGLFEVINVLFFGLAIGLVIGVINLALRGRLNDVLKLIAIQLLELVYLRRVSRMHDEPQDPKQQRMVPMAIPLALGIVISQIVTVHSLLGTAR